MSSYFILINVTDEYEDDKIKKKTFFLIESDYDFLKA